MRTLALIFFFLLVGTGLGFAQESINWLTWEEMKDLQEQERKKVFVDVYTDWCGWCKKMDASTFKDPEVVAAMNAYYYAVKLDAEMKDTIMHNNMMFVNINPDKKRGVHTLAASLLNSKMSYPSFVVLDENFNRNIIISGYQKVPELLANLLFFGTNQHVRHQEYLVKQQQAVEAAQQATASPNESGTKSTNEAPPISPKRNSRETTPR